MTQNEMLEKILNSMQQTVDKLDGIDERLLRMRYNNYISKKIKLLQKITIQQTKIVKIIEEDATSLQDIDIDNFISSLNNTINTSYKQFMEDTTLPTEKQVCEIINLAKTLKDLQEYENLITNSSARIQTILEEQKKKISKRISFADFVIKTNVFKCNANHSIEQIQAQIDIMPPSGVIITETISAGYCHTCECYFILEADFNRLRYKGVVLCQQITYDVYRQKGYAILNEDELKPESLLHRCGYNVSATEDLSTTQRREILCRVVDNNLYSISGICSHLDWLIRRNKKVTNRNMSDAISKWQQDRDFISKYKSFQNRTVSACSIKVPNSIDIDDMPF